MSDDLNRFLAEQGENVITRTSEGAVILSQLAFKDLQRLRQAVKRVYMRYYPVEFFTDHEADKMIESLAPSVVQNLIRRHVDGQLVDETGKVRRKYL